MQVIEAHESRAVNTSKGRQHNKTSPATGDRHNINIRWGKFALEAHSGNSWLILAIVLILSVTVVSSIFLLKIL